MIRDAKGHEYSPRITIGVLMEYERRTGIKFWTAVREGALVPGLTEMMTLFALAIKHQYPRLEVADVSKDFDGAAIQAIHAALTDEINGFFPPPPETPAEATPGAGA